MTTRAITEYAQLLWGLSLLFILTRSFLDLRGGVWLGMTLVAVIVLASTTVWLTADYVRNGRRRPSL
jgi:hypothetical protein